MRDIRLSNQHFFLGRIPKMGWNMSEAVRKWELCSDLTPHQRDGRKNTRDSPGVFMAAIQRRKRRRQHELLDSYQSLLMRICRERLTRMILEDTPPTGKQRCPTQKLLPEQKCADTPYCGSVNQQRKRQAWQSKSKFQNSWANSECELISMTTPQYRHLLLTCHVFSTLIGNSWICDFW